MDMEQRKTTWQNRINEVLNENAAYLVSPADMRRLVSICQDAFNEGHKAGYQIGWNEGDQHGMNNPHPGDGGYK